MRHLPAFLACLLLTGCFESEWNAFVYPNKLNFTEVEKLGPFGDFESCRDAAVKSLKEKSAADAGDYECGKNCDPALGSNDRPGVCEELRR